MAKKKIAISVDEKLVNILDSKAENNNESRSSIINKIMKDCFSDEIVDKAVILLKGEHQKYALEKSHNKKSHNKRLIESQIKLLKRANIDNIFIVTQKNENLGRLKEEVEGFDDAEIVLKDVKGTAEAVYSMKEKITRDFVVLHGDTYNDFELKPMISEHKKNGVISTMGLATKDEPAKYGSATLEGSKIIDFKEKKKSETHVVNAGVYVFSPLIFDKLKGKKSLEKEVFPRLAKDENLFGFFIHGGFEHAEG